MRGITESTGEGRVRRGVPGGGGRGRGSQKAKEVLEFPYGDGEFPWEILR